MRSSSVNNMLVLLAAILLAGPIGSFAQTNGFRMDQNAVLVNAMLDPVVTPNGLSSHMHKVIGGSRFKAAYNFDDQIHSRCTSAYMQADKSNYWMPSLYAYDAANKTYMSIPADIRFYYFLAPNSANDPVVPFPKGLRMLVGDPSRKTPTRFASFGCQISANFAGTIGADSFNFDRDCPWGMKTDLFFPACWNGKDLWKDDMSHMSHPAGTATRDGSCPITHPIRLPTIQLEYTWHTSRAVKGALRGKLRWANGDMTGYGIHGDFTNGWDLEVLERAMRDPTCSRAGRAISMSECPVLAPLFDASAAQTCRPESGVLSSSDPNENLDLVPLSAIPGCNPDWDQGPKPTGPCSPKSISVDGQTGWDGPYVADFDDRRDSREPLQPGWFNLMCVKDNTLKHKFGYRERNTMTATQCQNNCKRGNWLYAAIGELGAGEFMCYCGNEIDELQGIQTGMCTKPCPGNSTEICGGGQYLFSIYKQAANTPARPDPVVADGSTYMGCYQNDQWSQNGLTSQTTYTYQSYGEMTNAKCRETCGKLGSRYASTNSGNRCSCFSNWSLGGTGFVSDSYCNLRCSGNSSEFCGEYYYTSIFNVTTISSSVASVTRLPGWQGCMAETPGTVALNGAQWSRADMVPQQCINGCSELGFSRAGLKANTCFCGNTFNGGSRQPDNVCTTACAGNNTMVCGGANAIDVFDMTAATITPASLQRSKALPNYLGCFVDSGSTNAFVNPYVYPNDQMNAQLCARSCAQFGYTFAGLTNANTCKCGNAAPVSDKVVPTRYCTTACRGNSTQTCGGTGYLDAYDITTYVSTDPTVYKPEAWLGCYTDSGSGHTLNSMAYSASPLSSRACRTACANQGYTYAGTSNGNTCYCGNSLDRGQKTLMSNCNTPCQGNTNETCGGGDTGFVDVYTATGAAPFSGTPGYQGCFNDDNTLQSFQMSADWMSVEICAAQCSGRGFKIAGLRGGRLCKCGVRIPSYNIASIGCNTPCSANNTQWCGGGSTIAVYDLEKANRDSVRDNIAFDSTGFGGCYYEGGGRMLKDLFWYDSKLTVQKCITGCRERGYALAGAEYGSECYCGNELQWAGGYALNPTRCNMACAGGGPGTCGAPYVFSLYSTEQGTWGQPLPGISAAPTSSAPAATSSAPASSAPASSAPAPASSSAPASSRSAPASSSSAPASSSSAPASSSSAPASSSSAPASSTSRPASSSSAPASAPSSAAGTTPPVNAGPSAGGNPPASVAPTSASSSSAAAPAQSSSVAGCYGGSSSSFNNMRISSTAMSAALCETWCGVQGFAYAGLTAGNTCGCSANMFGMNSANGQCTSRCSGSARANCGGASAWGVSESKTPESACRRSEPEPPVLVSRDTEFETEEQGQQERVFKPAQAAQNVDIRIQVDGDSRRAAYPRRAGVKAGNGTRRWW